MILQNMTQTQRESLSIQINDTVIPADTVYKTFLYTYSKFTLVHAVNAEMFIDVWTNFKTIHGDDINRLYNVLSAKYNPLWNVDGTEETITGKKIDKIYSTPSSGVTHINERTFDNTDLTETSSSHTTDITSSETWADNTQTDTQLEGGYNSIEHIKHVRGGNIGITKSQELLKDETLIRTNINFVKQVLSIFAREELVF